MTDPTQPPTFPSLLQRFFIEYLGQQRAVSSRTITAYRDTFRLLLGFAEATIGKTPTVFTLADLDTKLILGFLDHLEKARNNTVRSRNARLAALRSFLKFAAHHDLSALAVIEQALAVPMKKFDRPMLGFLTRPEMQAVLDAPDPVSWAGRRDRVFFSVLYNTGARVSEAIGLRVGDVVTEVSPTANLRGKGRKERSVPLWRPTATLVRGWKKQLGDIKDDSFLFPNRSGGKLTRSSVTQRLALAVATATAAYPQLSGRAISPHTIRHTTAMHLLQSGVDITVIALWLGHESTTTTHMYLEADLSMKERALERLHPPGTKAARYSPPDQLMQFLQSL